MKNIKLFISKYYKLLIMIFVLVCGSFGIYALNKPKTMRGVTIIKEQEKKDPEELSKKLSSLKKKERQAGIANGSIDIFGLFDDYVIFGDSRALAFKDYGFLLENRIYAGTGHTIYNIDDWLPHLSTLKPLNIFVSYGVNDIDSNFNGLPGGYEALAQEQITKIKNTCPNSTIYVNSIIPAIEKVVQVNPVTWAELDEYNAALQRVCDKNGWVFIDNSGLMTGEMVSLYEPDGIHFQPSFYPIWAENMVSYLN